MEYPRREGCDDRGVDYEHLITALFSIRFAFLASLEEFWIASNVNYVGNCDDIVMSIKSTKGEKLAFFIQLKHMETEKKLQPEHFTYSRENKEGKRAKGKDKFSIEKYWRGFENFQERLTDPKDKSDFIKELKEAHKTIMILYTNREVDECSFLTKSDLNDDFLDLLDSSDTNYCYRFNHVQLPNYKSNFLEQLRLFSSQLHAEDLINLIKTEIRKCVNLAFPSMIDFEEVAIQYMQYVKAWAKGYKIGKKTKFYTLTKPEVLKTFTGILLNSYKYDFSKEKFTSYMEPLKTIWNEIVSDKDVTLLNENDSMVKFLESYYGSEVRKLIPKPPTMWNELLSRSADKEFKEQFGHAKVAQVCQNSELSMLLIYKILWMHGSVPVLLHLKNSKHFKDVLKILQVCEHLIKVIVLVKDSTQVKFKRYQLNYFVTFQDLTSQQQSALLSVKVNFQGRTSVPLNNLVDKSVYNLVKCHDVINILSKEFVVGNEFKKISVNICQLKQFILNLLKYFKREKANGGPQLALTSIQERVPEAVGVYVSSIKIITERLRECSILRSPKSKELLDSSKMNIRDTIYKMYKEKRHLTIASLINKEVREQLCNEISNTSLNRIHHEIGFNKFSKESNRRALVENNVAINRKHFMKNYLRNLNSEFKRNVVFLDKTWIFSKGNPGKSWQDSSTGSVRKPKGYDGKRFIVLHTGSKSLLFASKSLKEDYHGEMNGDSFKKWIVEKLICNLEEPSLIIIDNAPYHSSLLEKQSCSTWNKANIAAWLSTNNISFSSTAEVDEPLPSHGDEVLRLPPYHCEFNAIVLIWANCKTYNNKRIGRNGYGDQQVISTWEEALANCTPEIWQSNNLNTNSNAINNSKIIENAVQKAFATLFQPELKSLKMQLSDLKVQTSSLKKEIFDLKSMLGNHHFTKEIAQSKSFASSTTAVDISKGAISKQISRPVLSPIPSLPRSNLVSPNHRVRDFIDERKRLRESTSTSIQSTQKSKSDNDGDFIVVRGRRNKRKPDIEGSGV